MVKLVINNIAILLHIFGGFMDHLYLLSSSTIIGTIIVTLTYVYIYIAYRERYMGLWVISWFLFFSRLLLFDYGPFVWKQNVLGFFLYELLSVSSGLLFFWGVHQFIGKPIHKWWFYAGAGTSAIGAAFISWQFSFPVQLMPIALFSGITLMLIGRSFIFELHIQGYGHFINGMAFIFWGVLTMTMPYTVTIAWLSPWCYLAGGILRLIIACGTLLVYFERTRSDLIQKESQCRLLAENALDVIYRYEFGPVPRFVYMSPSSVKVTGYTPEEFYHDPTLLFSITDREFSDLFNPPLLYDPDINLPLTFCLKRKDEARIWIEQTYVPIYEKGALIALEGIIRDVTARKNMEQILSKVDKLNMVGQMAASVAHEIRNPLTSVRGYLQLMQRKQTDAAMLQRLELMISEIDRTNVIISEYLMLAQDKVPNLHPQCINDIITTLYPLIQATAVNNNMNVTLSLQDVPLLPLDTNEIRQLLLNLIKNSLEAMGSGGEILISTYRKRNKVILSVRDQGSGIPPNIQANAGTPFLTSKSTGSGLGLPICYRIASRHNADLHFITGSQGTTFFIEFEST